MTLNSVGNGFQLGDGTLSDVLFNSQGDPATTATGTTVTLTADNLASGIVILDEGGSSSVTVTLPTGTLMDARFTNMPINSVFRVRIINIATNASADATIAAGTGWTLVGRSVIASAAAATDVSSADVLLRRTGTGTWTLYW
jgi:hypothetical protein